MSETVTHNYQPKLSIQEGTVIFQNLRKKIAENNILKRSYGYYALAGTIVLIGICATGYAIIVLQNLLLLAVVGLIFAFFMGQVGGLMHDAGHRAIFKSTKMNDIFGNLCASVLFLNYRYWTIKHNFHHAHPNQEGKDPDIQLPIFSFTKKRFDSKKGVEKFFRKHQAVLYLPLTVFLAYSMQFKGNITYFIKDIKKGFRPGIIPEIALFLTFFFVWYVLPFLLFPIAKAIFLIVFVPLCIGFYLANIFAPNHKGMPEIDNETRVSFLEQQIVTSRNIVSNPITDIVYFGLHYQIEHHLFPTCPRNKLKKIMPHVKEICRETSLPYTTAGVLESFKIILSSLNEVAHH